MSAVKITRGEWVLVCDGTKALVIENVGDEKFPDLKSISRGELLSNPAIPEIVIALDVHGQEGVVVRP
jgi:protein required for attachment to host cells